MWGTFSMSVKILPRATSGVICICKRHISGEVQKIAIRIAKCLWRNGTQHHKWYKHRALLVSRNIRNCATTCINYVV